MNLRLPVSPARTAAPSLSLPQAPALASAGLAPSSVLAAPSLSPSFVPAPSPVLALDGLRAAQTAPDAGPAVLFQAGRSSFDAAKAVSAGGDAVPVAPSDASFLGRALGTPLHAAVSVPAALPFAAAADQGYGMLYALGAVIAMLVVVRLLPFNRPKAPLPRPAMPIAGTGLPELRSQVGALIERLYAASAGIRDLRRAIRAIDAEWARLRADGGAAQWRPHPGEWVMTPIHPSIFEAIALPASLRRIEAMGNGRNDDMLGDLLRGLSREPARASSAEDLLARLRWWDEHFRQFGPRGLRG